MNAIATFWLRELRALVAAPVTVVFLIAFLMLGGAATFSIGGFYLRGQADLLSFFQFMPALFVVLAPALSMNSWAAERRSGSIRLLLSLPVPSRAAVLGKFLATWTFAGIALVLTMPIWAIVNYLGQPDNGVIVAGYIGSLVLAGLYLAVGAVISALTRSATLAYVLTAAACLAVVGAAQPPLHDALQSWFGADIADALAAISVVERFAAISRGVLSLRDLAYFLLGITAALVGAWIAVERSRIDA